MADQVSKVKQCVLGKVILKQERVSEQDIIAIVQDQKPKPDTGHVGNGNMRIDEFTDTELFEARMVWRKMGKSVKRAVRCTSGRRKGRVVATAAQCGAPIDFKKRLTLKKTKARMGKRISRKAGRAKKFNPISRRVASMNKATRFKRRK
tara:strand:+ start:116 stop:562 length:447 start_codon:yes stop_codon:yes gene_type:complete